MEKTHIKATSNIFLPVYEKMFNLIFDTSIIPNNWLNGNTKPIYKNKGDPTDPKKNQTNDYTKLFGEIIYSCFE